MNPDYLDYLQRAMNDLPSEPSEYSGVVDEDLKDLLRNFKESGFKPETKKEVVIKKTQLNKKQRRWLLKVLEDKDRRITSIQFKVVRKVLIDNEYTENQKRWLDDIRDIYGVREDEE